MLVLDRELRVIAASRSFNLLFSAKPTETLGLVAIIGPPIAGLFSTGVFGRLFLIAGTGSGRHLRAQEAPGSGSSVLGNRGGESGGVSLWNPLRGLITLSYVPTALFCC
jgi:hypothetical protein